METKEEFEKPARKTGGTDWKEREEIFSRYVNAGRRRYFFDVKATRADDYYLVITESTRRYNDDGTDRYDRHRLFLYKEDFNKFSDRMAEVMDFIKKERGEAPIRHAPEAEKSSSLPAEQAESTQEPTGTTEKVAVAVSEEKEESAGNTEDSSEFTDLKFEDLGDTSEEKKETSEGEEKGDSSSDMAPAEEIKGEDSSADEDQPSASAKEEETEKAEKE